LDHGSFLLKRLNPFMVRSLPRETQGSSFLATLG
jgi:hypothetical protein